MTTKLYEVVTHDAGYAELWYCVKLSDGTYYPMHGPYRVQDQP